jgi:anti-sigma-K factor RskA
MEKEKFTELCSLYFLNALDESEQKEFNEALENRDKEFLEIYYGFQNTVLHLPLSADQIEPPAYIKRKLLDQIKQTTSVNKFSFIDRVISTLGLKNPVLVFAVSLILLTGVVVLAYISYQNESTIKSQNTLIVQLKDEVQKNNEILKVLSAKNINIIIMSGLEVNPEGYGKMILDPSQRRAIMQVSNLPETSKDKDYQLWVIKDNKPVSNGVFAISNKKENNYFMITNLSVQDLKNINAFAITLEPKGGVPQPTGKMYLLGNANL